MDDFSEAFKKMVPELEAAEREFIEFFQEEAEKHGTEIALMCLGKTFVVLMQMLQDNPKASFLCQILKLKVVEGLLDETGAFNPLKQEQESSDKNESDEEAKRTAENFRKDLFDVFGE